MSTVINAAIVYVVSVFAVGFVLGTVRVLVLAPRFGATFAVAVELPIILLAAWLLCRWTVRRFRVERQIGSRIVMGAIAFTLLMSAETLLSMLVFHRAIGEYISGFSSTAGMLGLAGQIVFAMIPALEMLVVDELR